MIQSGLRGGGTTCLSSGAGGRIPGCGNGPWDTERKAGHDRHMHILGHELVVNSVTMMDRRARVEDGEVEQASIRDR